MRYGRGRTEAAKIRQKFQNDHGHKSNRVGHFARLQSQAVGIILVAVSCNGKVDKAEPVIEIHVTLRPGYIQNGLGLAGTNMEEAASDVGVPFWAEFYGDVKSTDAGRLTLDRKKPWKIEDVNAHIRKQLEQHSVTSVEGLTVEMLVKDYSLSVCCYSDSPGCLDIINATKDVIAEYNQTLN